MATTFRLHEGRDLETLRALLRESSLASEFDILQAPHAVEGWLADPYHDPALHWLASVDDEPAGFGAAFVLPGREGRFAVMRLGVAERFRRRGLGTELLERAATGLREHHADVHELCLNAWLPAAGAEGFVARHGFERVRTFWLMERRGDAVAALEWPAGVRLAFHDGSERSYRDLTDAYNDSFAHHYHSALGTLEETRAIFTRPGFREDGYIMAYRGETCVGFCRCELHENRGEIAILGTVEAARGIGLGRALLRWGVQWLERERAARVTLLVDGENETALNLYLGEGFEVTRMRAAWSRPEVGPGGERAASAAAAGARARP